MMNDYLQLAAITLLPAALSCVVYLLQTRTGFGQRSCRYQQLVIGLLFGLAAIFCTEFGVSMQGATVSVRDAMPLTAGLLFGAPAGLLAGIIGGVERWFAAAWGAGMYSRIACSVSTVMAGIYAGLLRKYMFDDKRPTLGLGLAIGVVMEVISISMIFLTNLSDTEQAYLIARDCTVPIIVANALAVAAAIATVKLLSSGSLKNGRQLPLIAQRVQVWMLGCVVLAYVATTTFVYVLQTQTALLNADSLLRLNIEDAQADIRQASDSHLLELTGQVAARLEQEPDADLSALADQYQVSEINLVNSNGLIYASTNPAFIGFDMTSGEQAAAFMVLTEGVEEFVQEYQPITFRSDNGSLSRKYAGHALSGGGFVQVGYDPLQFRQDIAAQVEDFSVNRHVGENGLLLIADSRGAIVSSPLANLYTLIQAGIDRSVLNNGQLKPFTRQTSVTCGQECFWMYSQAENYYILALIPTQEVFATRNALVYINSFMEVLVFALIFALIYFLIKRLVVNNIRSVNSSLKRIIGGDLEVTVDVRSSSEFSSLSDDINSTVTTLKHYIHEAEARIDQELEFARTIQHSALPSVFPPFPDRSEFDIFATMDTAREVGGDFYDFYLLGRERLAFLIADVSGKGIPAAMFMMQAKTMLKNLAEEGLPVNEVLTRANDKLCENNEAGMFVTAWMGVLELNSGRLTFANAGHNPPLLKRADGSYEYLHSRPGLVLAGMEGILYRQQELELSPGDRLLLYTDGVTEATDSASRLYGEQRLLDFLNGQPPQNGEQTLQAISADIDRFVGEAEQFDDITLLVMDFYGRKEPTLNEKSFPARLDALDAVTAFVERELEEADCGPKSQMQIAVAVEEVFVNVASYAYPEGKGQVSVGVGVEERTACIRFSDDGLPFDPLQKADPDITLSAEERAIGGLGIFMVKKTMDNVTYAYQDGHNVLTLYKKI